MRVKPIVAWYDGWVGYYWDAKKRSLYILPIPCVGIVIEFGVQNETHSTEEVVDGKCPSCGTVVRKTSQNQGRLRSL